MVHFPQAMLTSGSRQNDMNVPRRRAHGHGHGPTSASQRSAGVCDGVPGAKRPHPSESNPSAGVFRVIVEVKGLGVRG